MNLLGFTYGEHNPDSWEGWHWGAMHMWGFSHRLGHPRAVRPAGRRAQEHRDDRLLVRGPGGHVQRRVRRPSKARRAAAGSKSSGVKMIFIDPYFNHTAGLLGDKWFAPRLGTDVAFGLAIAYTWLTEGTYDKEYIAGSHHRLRRVEGLRPRQDGRPGQDAGVGGGQSAASRRGEIRALAREWASQEDHARCRRPGRHGRRLPGLHGATSGRAPWSPSPPCRAWASRAATSGPPRRARR